MRRFLALVLFAVLAACSGEPAREGASARVTVFAAASLREVARELGSAFGRREPVELTFNLAGSNTLAQQILAAPRADVFLSADGAWVDVLEEASRLVPGTRRPFLANRLVLVARADAGFDAGDPWLLAEDGYRMLALADPEGVPAGRYARGYLERARGRGGTLWQSVQRRVAPALDVRAALALVESDPELLGIVYRTDAATSDRIRVLHEFPPLADLPVLYWAALVAGGPAPGPARRFLDFLGTPEATAIARRHGFLEAGG